MWQVRKPRANAARGRNQRRPRSFGIVTIGDAGAFANRNSHTDLKVELHQRLLDLINLSALDKMSREQIEEEVGDIVLEELDKQHHALNQAERQQAGRRRARRAARASGRSSRCSRTRRSPTFWSTATTACSSSATACSNRRRCGSRTRSTCCGSSRRSSRRSAGASMNPRRWSTRAWPTAAASTRSSRRWRSTARCSRSANSPRCRSAWRA